MSDLNKDETVAGEGAGSSVDVDRKAVLRQELLELVVEVAPQEWGWEYNDEYRCVVEYPPVMGSNTPALRLDWLCGIDDGRDARGIIAMLNELERIERWPLLKPDRDHKGELIYTCGLWDVDSCSFEEEHRGKTRAEAVARAFADARWWHREQNSTPTSAPDPVSATNKNDSKPIP